jgi:hypothetical protein
MKDVDFQVIFENFNEGNAPLSHIDDKTFIGNKGQSSDAQADVISRPGFLTQGPALANLTNGTQAGVVNELIRFIMDKPVSSSITYAIGTGKLFKLSSTTVASGGSPSWPQSVANMTSGESVIRLKTNIYGFYNKASGGDILKMDLATETITANWGSVTDAALQSALHPSAVKEDILMFGNGRYAGIYIEGLATLDVDKLDFGEGSEVADIVFNANVWWIAVNSGVGGRQQSQVYIYDGSALSNILADEAGIGFQKIGWLYVVNGIVYICYQDLSSGIYTIGYFAGRQIKPLRYFTGTLPDHRQKTLYKNTILFASQDKLWSCGAVVEQLPIQISKLADGGYATLGAVAAPFGTPMIASTDVGSNFRLAKFSGYAVDSYWKSDFVDITQGKNLGRVNTVIVHTKPLGASAKATLILEGNQAGDAGNASSTLSIETTGKTRHVFNTVGLAPMEDVRVAIDFATGNASNDCPIRKIVLLGNYVER